MDWTLSAPHERIRRQLRSFVRDRLLPLELDPASYDEHENVAPALL